MKDFLSICKQAQLSKRSAALLTPEAEAAAVPPQDPNAMGGMPPQGGMPMDPSMMQGGMPPQGAPMDPNMMGGQPLPQDPSIMGGAPMPPPGAWMQDQGFIQFLMQLGVQIDQQGNAIDPNGQPIPPEMLDQLYAQYQQQMVAGGQPPMDPSMQGGMLQDPSMMGGQPPVDPNTGMPMDPSMMGGDPNAMGMDPSMMQDPNAMGGMPPEQGMDPSMQDPNAAGQDMGQGMPQDIMNNMASIIMDSVDSVLDERMAALDKKISAFADKLDSIKSMLDDLALGTDTASKKQQLDNDKLNAELEADLRGAQQPQQQQLAGTQDLMKSASVKEVKPVRSILDIMRG